MKVIYLKAQESIFQLEPSVIAIGYFDGLHLGHMQLLHEVEQIAAATGLKKGFMTFDQHPQVVFGKKDFQYLMSLQQKISLIENMGFDYFFIIEFNQSVAQKQPLEFINSYLIKNRRENHERLNSRSICHSNCNLSINISIAIQGRSNSRNIPILSNY